MFRSMLVDSMFRSKIFFMKIIHECMFMKIAYGMWKKVSVLNILKIDIKMTEVV